MQTTGAAATVASAGRPNQTVEFTSDYRHRRVKKKVFNMATSTVTSERKFIYDGWNVIAETDGGGTIKRSFAWGLDISGSAQGAGGVGGLLQIHDYEQTKTLFPCYDGNGNIGALINAEGTAAGTIEASYEYSPFGELQRCAGAYAAANPFRFSTKWQDDESGLVYYGVRYYAPREGRFLGRDPIEEEGGLNLYGFCGNDGVNQTDYLGYSWFSKQLGSVGRWINKNKQVIIVVVAIVASIVTYGAASGWAMGAMTATQATATAAATYSIGGVAISAGTAGVIAGAVGGAAAGFVGGAMGTALNGGNLGQTVSSGLRGAAAGVIMGGVSGYFGNTWNASRVLANGVAGGTGSEIMGGDFKTGFIVAGAFAAARWGWDAIKVSVDRSALSSTYDKSVNPKAPSSLQYDENGLLRTDGTRPTILEQGRSEYADNWFTRSGMASEGSGKHLYDSGQWLEQRLGNPVAQFARTFVNAVSKIHDWQNSWGYDSVGRFVSRGQLYDTLFQSYSMAGMPVAGLTTAALLGGANQQVQQQYLMMRRKEGGG
jgi:RHS repeat-associated protein